MARLHEKFSRLGRIRGHLVMRVLEILFPPRLPRIKKFEGAMVAEVQDPINDPLSEDGIGAKWEAPYANGIDRMQQEAQSEGGPGNSGRDVRHSSSFVPDFRLPVSGVVHSFARQKPVLDAVAGQKSRK